MYGKRERSISWVIKFKVKDENFLQLIVFKPIDYIPVNVIINDYRTCGLDDFTNLIE